MAPARKTPLSSTANQPPRGGFSFAEVMFAVVILGIGFIMVAGIFPVALQQTQTTSEQAAAAAFARGSSNLVQQIAQYTGSYGHIAGVSQPTGAIPGQYPAYVFPFESGATNSFVYGSWYGTSGDLIAAGDPRFAVVPLYMRPQNAKYLQLYLIGVQSRNAGAYTPADLTLPDSATPSVDPATLQPKLLSAQISSGSPALIRFAVPAVAQATWAGVPTADPTYGNENLYYTTNGISAVATGAYLIVAADSTGGAFNGKVYRVGNQRLDLQADGSEWELVPGGDLVPQTVNGTLYTGITADVWMVGKSLQQPGVKFAAGSNIYAGPVQDVSLYTTFVPLP